MTKKILIVEDNAQDQKLIKLTLIKGGYKDLLFASTGEEGLVLAKSKKPDLIILDINLPKMNGVECHRTLKEDAATKPIPILFMTNLLKKDDAGEGMDRFIAKSSLLEDLIRTIKTILGS